MRSRSITDEILQRAAAFLDRRAGPGARRGARARGGTGGKKDPLLYALTSFSAANLYLTLNGSVGETGVASGFGAIAQVVVTQLNTGAHRVLAGRTNSSDKNWALYLTSSNTFVFYARNGADTALLGSGALALAQSDLGRVFTLLGWHDGTQLRLSMARGAYSTATAISGYTVTAGVQQSIGANGAGQGSAPGTHVLGHATFRGVPSLSQIDDYLDRARLLGDLPDLIAGATMTTLWSAKRELRGQTVVSGQTGPAQLTEKITLQANTALSRQGSPTVVTIDPSRDGRRMLGVQGWSPSNLCQTNGGIRGSSTSGLWVGFYGRLDALAAGMALSRYATSGWYLQQSAATTFRFVIFDAGGAFTASPNFTVSSADLAQPMAILAQYTGAGGALRLYAKRVQQGADVTGAITLGVPTTPMQVGFYTAQPYASTIAGIVGANRGDLTLAEIQEWFDAIERTGRIAQIAGKTSAADGGHLYDFTQDILDAGDAVPAQILDRIGTDHLTRVGGLRVTTTPANGIADFSSAHWIQSAGVTLPGAAGGFYAECLGYYVAGASAEDWFSCAAFAATAGWRLGSWNGYANVQAGDGAAAKGAVGSALMSPGLNHLALVYDGSVLKQFLNGTLYNTTTTFTYAVSTLAASFGINRPSAPANITAKSAPLGGAYGLIAPSDAQIAAAASAALSAGRIVGVPGHSQRYDLVQDVIDAGGKVPAIWRERVANTNTMTTVGAPLQVAQRTERTWSYETTPVIEGASFDGDTSKYLLADTTMDVGLGGLARWYALSMRVDSQAVTSATRRLLGTLNAGGTLGSSIFTSGTNASVAWTLFQTNGAALTSPSCAIVAADIGKILLFLFSFDSTRARSYFKRAESGTGSSAASGTISDPPGPLYVGRTALTGGAAEGVTLFELACGDGLVSLAEFQALSDDCLAFDGQVRGIPNKTKHRWKFGVNGTVPVSVADLVGSMPLPRQGTIGVGQQFARAFHY